MAKYLNLDYKTSQMYEYSKTAKEGFEPMENGQGFRLQYDKGVIGELQNIGVRDGKFGQQLQVSLKDQEGDYVNLQWSLYDQKNNVDSQYSESIIRFLRNLKKGTQYRFYPYKITAEDQKAQDQKDGKELRNKYYNNTGVSIKTIDAEGMTKVEPYLQYSGEGETTIPKLVWKENAMGDNKITAGSQEERNEFLLKELKLAQEGHLAFEGGTSTSSTAQENTQTSTASTATTQNQPDPVVEESNDDLPF